MNDKKNGIFTHISLEDGNLHVERVKSKDGIVVDTKKYDYPLKEITTEELLKKRASGNPGFVLKIKEKYFYTRIPKNLKLISKRLLGEHKCSHCRRCRADSDIDGGCQKVRDRDFSFYKGSGDTIEEAIRLSGRIEKYSFIPVGYESFNTTVESMVVAKCSQIVDSGETYY